VCDVVTRQTAAMPRYVLRKDEIRVMGDDRRLRATGETALGATLVDETGTEE
jgi:hypothetical protein